MTTLKIAFRNIFRNRRRSLMTLLAIAVGGVATLLFGAFIIYSAESLQTSTVQRLGHLSVFRAGYFDYGAGNPAAYGISDYQATLTLITMDPMLRTLIAVATPTQSVFGIAGNYEAGTSKTFFGDGVVPSDRARMRQWNEFGLASAVLPPLALSDEDVEGGIIGQGLGRILGFCDALKIANCPPAPPASPGPAGAASALPPEDFSGLQDEERSSGALSDKAAGRPRVDLLAATAGGAPNVVNLYVNKAEFQGQKELDDSRILMPLELAQRLLYGRGEHEVTSIVLQLDRSEDMAAARARLMELFKEHELKLEVRDFVELSPYYSQAVNFLLFIFSFIAAIIAMIVLFTIINTMGMTVMERTNEIGTLRALGVQRSELRWQFVAEGCMLGAIGAAVGLAASAIIAFIVNHAGVTWTPPGLAGKIPLVLNLFGTATLVVGTGVGLVLVSTIAAFVPAQRAAKLPVVEALRHL